MRIFSFTDRGKVRQTNEDALWMNGELGLFLVADGIGSGGRGAEASQGVVRACREALKGSPRPEELLPTLIRKANNVLYELGTESRGSCGATLALLWLRGREARVAWVGDSRVYRLRQGQLERLTSDHTRTEELTRSGAVPVSATPRKSALTRSLGQGPTIEFDQAGPFEIQTADLFMVATDGVTDVLGDDVLSGFLARGPIQGSAAIRQAALEKGGPDNLTAILVEMEPTDLERTLDAAQIAAVLKDAAGRDAIKLSRQAQAAVLQQEAPRGMGAFFRGIFAGGAQRVVLEILFLLAFVVAAFLTPDLLQMAGHRLENVPLAAFLAAGVVLYLLAAKLRAG